MICNKLLFGEVKQLGTVVRLPLPVRRKVGEAYWKINSEKLVKKIT